MSWEPAPLGGRPRVVVVGGGMAGIEAVLALRALAGDAVDVTLVAPHDHLPYTPLSVAEPFGGAPVRHYPLAGIARDAHARFVRDAVAHISPRFNTVVTTGGRELLYDDLIVAVGAQRSPSLPGAFTFAGAESTPGLRALLAGLQTRTGSRLAIVVPAGPTWPLPAYELALLAAKRLSPHVSVEILTPEASPLECFGAIVSAGVEELLERSGIALRTGAVVPTAAAAGADRVIALPTLTGPRLRGLPRDNDGFIPVDSHGRVTGLGVFAAGDGTSYPLKQGGIATQVADAAAAVIARRAGVEVPAEPFAPVLRAVLLTGDGPRFLESVPGEEGSGIVSRACPWSPPSKVVGRHLAQHLAERDATGAYTTLPLESVGP